MFGSWAFSLGFGFYWVKELWILAFQVLLGFGLVLRAAVTKVYRQASHLPWFGILGLSLRVKGLGAWDLEFRSRGHCKISSRLISKRRRALVKPTCRAATIEAQLNA